jgi:hypothetical protein
VCMCLCVCACIHKSKEDQNLRAMKKKENGSLIV